MAHPLWTGSISFGLLHIPVQLVPAERRTELRFHQLDARNKARVRYERINAETGEEVPWKDIVKAYEYRKGSYVVLEEEDLKAAAPESSETVEIQSFVDPAQIDCAYYERPYYLVPAKKAEKGYVLLRETLRKLRKAGLAKVVIRTREYLSLLVPHQQALMLLLLRYPQELIQADQYAFPERSLQSYRLSRRELGMAEQLVESMSAEWSPDNYRDEFRSKLSKVINKRLHQRKSRVGEPKPQAGKTAGKVVDFMAVLQRSLEQKQQPTKRSRRPAAASARRRRNV